MAKKFYRSFFVLIGIAILLITATATSTESKIGDVVPDGNITASDARLVLRASAQLENLTDEQIISADVNNDKFITAADARLILRVAACLDSFPVIESESEHAKDDEIKTDTETEVTTENITSDEIVDETENITSDKIVDETEKKPVTVPGYLTAVRVSGISTNSKNNSSICILTISNKHYLFLPANIDKSALIFTFDSTKTAVKLNGTSIKSGEKTDILTNLNVFTLSINDSNYDVNILESANIPSMYISTESGSMSNVNANKEYKEAGEMVLVNADGSIEYDNSLDYIKGRGNSSWNYSKKGYNIKLDKSTSLCELGKTKKWSLIPNHIDKSLLRNQILYNLADDIGLDFSPACTQIDLYLNGCYNGTYLLVVNTEIDSASIDITDLEKATENVNENDLDSYTTGNISSDSRLLNYKFVNIPNNPDDITGGYMLELDHSSYNKEISGFTTSRSQRVVVKSPEYASKEQVQYIANWYQDFEDAVYSENGYNSKGKYYTEYIDIESFAKYYLLSEIAMNGDSHITSVFMYKESAIDGDGLLHAGPVWDYDSSLGNNGGTKGFSVNVKLTNAYQQFYSISKIYKNMSVDFVYAALYKHSDFRTLVADIYKNEVSDAYNKLLTEDYQEYVNTITPSANMNFKRWNIMPNAMTGTQTGTSYSANIDNLFNFLSNKKSFLDKIIDAYYEDYLYIFVADNNTYGVISFADNTIELFSGEAEIGDTVAHGGKTFTIVSIKSDIEPEPDTEPESEPTSEIESEQYSESVY